jgi:crotonobetainyl-CoA:carnitine CoA-transferase CaiB-like acyl-CoA transferase
MPDTARPSPANQTWPTPSGGLPLSGFRITEMTTAWAGPMAGRILACLGAETIHIEPANNLDSWRSYNGPAQPKRYPDQQPGERRYNRAALFNSQNTDKLSFSLDLKSPGGKDAFRDLIAKSDGLITNFTPGMLERLGFSNDVLWSIRPDLVIVEMPAYGNSGLMRSSVTATAGRFQPARPTSIPSELFTGPPQC